MSSLDLNEVELKSVSCVELLELRVELCDFGLVDLS